MKVHIAEIGERAMTNLLMRMRGATGAPALQILAPELVIRASTARAARNDSQHRKFAKQEGSRP
jgi:DNA-binding LacI/PurR family transcriptional regulator